MLELDTAGKLKNQFTVPENINAVVYSSANDEVLIATTMECKSALKKQLKYFRLSLQRAVFILLTKRTTMLVLVTTA